jgi:hypothetical protein
MFQASILYSSFRGEAPVKLPMALIITASAIGAASSADTASVMIFNDSRQIERIGDEAEYINVLRIAFLTIILL